MKRLLALLCAASLTLPIDAASANLVYYGGPVVGNSQVVMVNWGASVPSAVQANLPTMYSDIVQSDYWTILSEYATTGLNGADGGGAGSNQQLGPGNFVQQVTITPAICTGTTCSDTQVDSELAAQINAGKLPAPTTDGLGHVNTVYMVHFPAGFTLTYQTYSSCADFCAIYSNFTANSLTVAAGLVPDQSGACALGCGGGASVYLDREVVTSVHVLANVVTDPLLPSVTGTSVVRPAAWYNSTSGNIATICSTGGNASIATNSHSYVVPKLWSNSNNACISAGSKYVVRLSVDANGTVSPAFSQAVAPNTSATFTVTPDAGFVAVIGGTCGGNLAGATYTTNAVVSDCSVAVTFSDRIFASGFES